LKGNRATLHAHVCAFFAGGDACGWENTKVDRWEQTEKSHGRVEHRVVEAIAYGTVHGSRAWFENCSESPCGQKCA
jgi:hypothetical protein